VCDAWTDGLGMTPDGISSKDWARVHELAVDVANLFDDDEGASNEAARQLLEVLDELQHKYGPLPSILSTRADYVVASADREYWLLAAHEEAIRRDDIKNQRLIAHSLAAYYIEEEPSAEEGQKWLDRLGQLLQLLPDDHEAQDVARWRGILERGRP